MCFTQASFGWDDGGEDWCDNDHGNDGDDVDDGDDGDDDDDDDGADADAGDPKFVRKLAMVMVKLSLKDDSCL